MRTRYTKKTEGVKMNKKFTPFGTCKICGYPLAFEIDARGKTRIFCERCEKEVIE